MARSITTTLFHTALLTVLTALVVQPSSVSAGEEAAAEDKTEDGQGPTREEELDMLLAQTLGAEDYAHSQNCMNHRAYRNIEIVSNKYLLFSRGNTYWLNRLRTPCRVLDDRDVVLALTGGGSLCKGDAVYVTDRHSLTGPYLASGRPAVIRGSCHLGAFQEIDEQQALALQEYRP